MTKKSWVGDSGAGLDYDDNPAKTAAPNDPGGNIESNPALPVDDGFYLSLALPGLDFT